MGDQTVALAWATSMQQAIIEANREELQPLKHDLAECKTRLTNVEQKQESMEGRLNTLERNGGSSTIFLPSYMEIKKGCDFQEVRTKGIGRVEATTWYDKLFGDLPQKLHGHVREFRPAYPEKHTMQIPVDPEHLTEVLNHVPDPLRDPSDGFSGRELWATAGRHPAVEGQYMSTGKVIECVKDSADAAAEMKGLRSPDFDMSLDWRSRRGNKTETFVGRVLQGGRVVCNGDGLKLIEVRDSDAASSTFGAVRWRRQQRQQ